MKKLLTLLCLSIGVIGNSFAEENWSLIDDTRLITRGDIVWGHQFGFMKDLSLCGYDVMLLSWSSDISNGKLKEFEGKAITLLAPVIKARKGHYKELFKNILKRNWSITYYYFKINKLSFFDIFLNVSISPINTH